MIDFEGVKSRHRLSSVIQSAGITLKPKGASLVGLCPFHEERTASFHVYDDKGQFHCFGCEAHGDVFDFLLKTKGLDAQGAAQFLGEGPVVSKSMGLNLSNGPKPECQDNSSELLKAWDAYAEIGQDSTAMNYLRSRGIKAAPYAESVRECAAAGGGGPALVGRVMGPDGDLVALHRIQLKADGSAVADVKVPKRSEGRVSGGAVRLSPRKPTVHLVEGIEDGLSLLEADPDLCAWSTLGASNYAKVVFPKSVEHVVLAGDRDEAGKRAVQAAVDEYRAKGLQVSVIFPPAPFKDWNELLVSEGPEALRAAIANPVLTSDATNDDEFGIFDISAISITTSEPPALPMDCFGPWSPFVERVAEGTGSPKDFVALPLLVCAASLIGVSRRVKPFKVGEWSEPAILFGALVGEPSTNKSPAMDAVVQPLKDFELDYQPDYEAAIEAYERDKELSDHAIQDWRESVKTAQKEGKEPPLRPTEAIPPAMPVQRRLVLGDITPEAAISILSANPKGVLVARDELAGWISSFDRYNSSSRSMWLEAFGGRQFAVDRVKNEGKPQIIAQLAMSLIGTIQPDKILPLIAGDQDGLIARFLTVWPNPVPFARPTEGFDRSVFDLALRRLSDLSLEVDEAGRASPVTLPLSDVAADLFEEWVRENDKEGKWASSLYAAFIGKSKGLALRIALVLTYLDWAASGSVKEPQVIDADTMARSVTLMSDFFQPMAKRLYGDAAKPISDKNASTLARYVVEKRLTEFNASDLRRHANLPGLREAAAMDAACLCLEEAGWIVRKQVTGKVGRRAKAYLVNPKVWEAFSE